MNLLPTGTEMRTLAELERELASERRTAHGTQVAFARARGRVRQTLAKMHRLEQINTLAVGSRFIPDVSEYTGAVDWAAVKAGGTWRAIAKATQYRADWQFAANWRGMHAAGFTTRGAYHYFTEEPAQVQARRLLDVVDAAGGLPNPFSWGDQYGPYGDFLALDFEQAYAGVAGTRAELERLIGILHQRVGPRILLYTGGPFWNQATGYWTNDLGCILWHAAYVTNPNQYLPACWHPKLSRLWQFTDGRYGNRPHTLLGLPNPVDISVTLP